MALTKQIRVDLGTEGRLRLLELLEEKPVGELVAWALGEALKSNPRLSAKLADIEKVKAR